MKLNKTKNNKGKVHPSPSPSSSPCIDPSSTLANLLPTTILTLISILSLQDKEVLAYMITHSFLTKKTFNNNSSSSKRATHKVPSFDCGCFECYTTYWFRWDHSPHRELIHQAIDSFEELNLSTPSRTSAEVENLEVKGESSKGCADVEGCGSNKGYSQHHHQQQGVEHKGLARKVLPDVIGLFNSRLWNLWGPNV